jgi:hypothetical protein
MEDFLVNSFLANKIIFFFRAKERVHSLDSVF